MTWLEYPENTQSTIVQIITGSLQITFFLRITFHINPNYLTFIARSTSFIQLHLHNAPNIIDFDQVP